MKRIYKLAFMGRLLVFCALIAACAPTPTPATRMLVLPEELSQGTILPAPPDPEAARMELEAALEAAGLEPTNFDLSLVAVYTDNTFYAAPTVVAFDEYVDDVVVGLLWDVAENAFYEVRAVGETAILTDLVSGETLDRSLLEAKQPQPVSPSFVVFVEGSCWACFCFDERAICFGC